VDNAIPTSRTEPTPRKSKSCSQKAKSTSKAFAGEPTSERRYSEPLNGNSQSRKKPIQKPARTIHRASENIASPVKEPVKQNNTAKVSGPPARIKQPLGPTRNATSPRARREACQAIPPPVMPPLRSAPLRRRFSLTAGKAPFRSEAPQNLTPKGKSP
jgi:hypothetical protein